MRIFTAEDLCVSVEDIDFHNPGRLSDGRERGARIELRLVQADTEPGSIYVSRALSIGRAVCRFDLLESAPGAADRMHWHPIMANGEPGERQFEPALREDPLGWLGERLRNAVDTLRQANVEQPERFTRDAEALARVADAVVADTADTLARARQPWPQVRQRDERGMPLAS